MSFGLIVKLWSKEAECQRSIRWPSIKRRVHDFFVEVQTRKLTSVNN